MTRDLRRRALESHKTVSKKAASRIASPATSKPASRAASRAPSDDEDAHSDGTDFSTGSFADDTLSLDGLDLEDGTDAWKANLEERIEEIIARKGSTVGGRELAYRTYNHLLSARYCYDEVDKRYQDLLAAFTKSIKQEASEKEVVFAIRAICLTVITRPSDTAHVQLRGTLKRVYADSESEILKAAAISALGVVTTFGGAGEEDMGIVMDELREIVESDGASIDATDSGSVVTAALEEWGFLATHMDDLEDRTEEAMEAFVEQLDSGYTSVQVAAGENIALLYEKSYSPREADDPAPDSDEEEDEDGNPMDHSEVKRYDVYRNANQLKSVLHRLANVSAKSINRKDRKSLHANFADILNTVEHPMRGPRYQNAIDQETGRRYGSRMTVRIHKSGVMRINKWWKYLVLQEFRRVLGGGFVTHYERNNVVFESLP
jgi:hypothetical protein